MKNSILLLSVLLYCHLSYGQNTVTYTSDGTNIANPERGFYRHTETNSTEYTSLDVGTLADYRANGFTLILRVFYLNDFTESSISNSYLEKMRSDFQIAKQAGVKVIVRFAYTKSDAIPYGDASLENVLVHIEQLKPVLHEYKDVIAFLQAGFIGAWGEWYYTDHFSVQAGVVNEQNWVDRRAFVDALLEAVPPSIMVQVRTPAIKFSLLEDEVALTTEEAFTTNKKARLAHHNDCFLASANDVGTYSDIDAEKAYLEIETQYLVMGGETCGISVPYSECPNALAELERFHWSYLNIDYHGGVLSSWRDDGCFDEIELNLGYRYKLLETTADTISKPGGEYAINISLDNDGWANVYNKRNFEIVLKNQSTEQEYYFKTNEEPRRWSLSSATSIDLTLGIPDNIEEGNYSVYASMPDQNSSLYSNSNYAVRMANTDTWNAELGYNDLGITLNISTSNTADSYSGSDLFTKRNSSSSNAAVAITIDGNVSDWNTIPVAFSSTTNSVASDIKLYNDREDLYFSVIGNDLNSSYQIFIDLDKSSDTGYHAWQWTNNGAELLIESGSLYTYSGSGNGWGWTFVKALTTQKNDTALELSISLSDIGDLSNINYAYVNDPSNTIEVNYLPSQNDSFLEYNLYLTDNVDIFSGADSDRILLYWSKLNDAFTRILERSEDGGQFEIIATVLGGTEYHLDFDVVSGVNYEYRFFLQNENNISSYSKVITESTTSGWGKYYQFAIDGDDSDWYALSPLSTQSLNTAYSLRTFWGSKNVNFMISGEQVDNYSIYVDTDNDETTGSSSAQDSNIGYDYLIHNDSLFEYSGGSWVFQTECEVANQDKSTELSFALSELANLDNNQQINITTYYNIGTDTVFLPNKDGKVLHVRSIPSKKASNFGVRKSGDVPKSRLVITWDNCDDCDGYILERSLNGVDFSAIGDFDPNVNLVQDNDLTDETEYFYRVFTYTDIGPSAYSDILSETTGEEKEVLSLTEKSSVNIKLYPNPVKDILHLESKVHSEKFQIQILSMSGKVVYKSGIDISENASTISIRNLKKGVYLMVLKNSKMILQRKIIKK